MKRAALTIDARHKPVDGAAMIKTCCRALCFITLGILGVAQGTAAQQRQPPSAKRSINQPLDRQAAVQVESKTRLGSISGRVITESGQPVPFATVNVLALGRRTLSATSTDKDGKFQVTDLASGVYEVRPAMEGYVPVTNDVGLAGEPSFYRLGDTVTIVMTRGGVISGRVVNADGEPVVQALVRDERVRDERGRAGRSGSRGIRPGQTDERGE